MCCICISWLRTEQERFGGRGPKLGEDPEYSIPVDFRISLSPTIHYPVVQLKANFVHYDRVGECL